MNREEKAAVVEELATQISESEAIFAIDYRGISVPQAAELRSKLRESDATFRVSKNRLAKLAAAKAGQESLNDVLVGPTALTFVKGDTAAAAKTITTFAKANDVLTFKGGLLGDLVLDEGRFKSIAQLPSRDALNAQLAGVVASPITGLVRGLGSMISGLAIALGQVAEQGLVGGNAAPAAESQAESGSEASASSPDGSGSEAEQPAADETPAPSEEPSADDSSATSEEAKPSEDSPEAAETPSDEPAATEETSTDSENNEE